MSKVENSHKLFHNLKSQGLSLQTIIIAAIALVVLIVLIAVFTSKSRLFVDSVEDCTSKGGDAMDAKEDGKNPCPTMSAIPMKGDKYCCIPLFEDDEQESN